jgi:hypothetical protein
MKSVIFNILLFVLGVVLLSSVQSRPITLDDIDSIPSSLGQWDELGHRTIFDFIVVGAGAAGCIVAGR